MYESPITAILTDMETLYEKECVKVVQSCGFNVNKDELTKALQYDRKQYDKGYADGYNDCVAKMRKSLIEIDYV